MRRVAIVLLLGLLVSGCATFFTSIQNPINRARLAEIESAYGAVLAVANGYRQLYKVNRCTVTSPESATNLCARRSVVILLQNADRRVQISLVAARRFISANPTLDASSILDALQTSVETMRQIENLNGVH